VPQPDAANHLQECNELQARLTQTALEAHAAIERVSDLIERLHIASHAAITLHRAADELSTLRAEIISQIAEDEDLSLSKLAARIGVSKTRANQLRQAGDRIRRLRA
jgi:AraC-like DNA-binding protein